MCGILALVSKENDPNLKAFEIALEKQKHRGPDGSRTIEVAKNTLFGFNRLTIQDLTESSMQPFSYEGNWLVFNGEIYNYKELREDLIRRGMQFSTTGDTEVLCVGLSVEGSDFIKKLNGIFAFCFYDRQKNTFLIARDMMGVKPLFYADTEDNFVAASDIRSLLQYIRPEVDMETVHTHTYLDWFIGGFNQEKTFFKNISALSRGTLREYDGKGDFIREEFYGTLDYSNTFSDPVQIEHVFAGLLDEALSLETRSDTKVGFLLSGGIDSSAIAAFSTPYLIQSQKRIPVFTFYYKEKGEQEDLIYSENVLDDLRKKHGDVFDFHHYNLDANLDSHDFEEVVLSRATPVTDIRQISLIHLYRKVHEHGIKVILNGQGSDEVYYGYYPLDYWMSCLYRKGSFDVPGVMDYYANELNRTKHTVYNDTFLKEARDSSEKHLEKMIGNLPKSLKEKEKRMTAFFVETILQSMMLYEDKASMYSSVEVRVPLINRLLVEYISQCDFHVNLISSTSGRHLLRKALKGILSEKVIARPKSPTPKKKHYSKELRAIFLEHKESIVQSSLLNTIYKPDFLENPFGESNEESYAFYGNNDDVVLEMLGYFFFERTYLL
jgi:asparagine synthase (glutamine-hydrolysing)